jgi:hypothetical protein
MTNDAVNGCEITVFVTIAGTLVRLAFHEAGKCANSLGRSEG